MTEKKLRELLRKEIKAQLTESPADFLKNISGTVRSALGSKKSQLAAGLDKINADRIAKLPADKKAEVIAALVAQVGLTKDDYEDVKMRIGRKLGVMSEGQKSNEQMLNENMLIDLAQALADIGLNYSADAIEMAAKGDFSAMGNAIDNAMKVPKEAATLVLSLFGIAAGTGGSAKAAKQAVSYIQSKIDGGGVNMKSNVKDLVKTTADPVQAEAFTKYNKQKALLEAKRRSTAKRKK